MQDFIQYLQDSPVSFFAVRALCERFDAAGFSEAIRFLEEII